MTAPMLERVMPLTIDEAFRQTVERYPGHDFIVVPPSPTRGYLEQGLTFGYEAAARAVAALAERYREAGYGCDHRVAVALDNRPEHVLHRLALNSLGVSCVPVNPDYRPGELAYLLQHSEAVLIVHLERNRETIAAANALCTTAVVCWCPETDGDAIPPTPARAASTRPMSKTESSLLYTSGTTGRPKGCMLSHQYELMCAAWYADMGGMVSFRPGRERLYNPLPLYHVNAGVISLLAMMLLGGCQIQPDRFHPRAWWSDINATGATLMHYLGVVAPMLLNQPEHPLERAHDLRFGFGAGVAPELHAVFETRFGFPIIELWGMTEMCRILTASHEPRRRGTRAIGRPVPGLEVEIRDEDDRPVALGTVGELVVRHSAMTPRLGAFSGYLKDEAATEEAWRGGWLHTGDCVLQGADGMLHFVERRKNIIRRSGENIAAAEVEAVLETCVEVTQVAVLAVPDPIREEEVLACIVPAAGVVADEALAGVLFAHCNERLAYYKPPGWIRFVDALPTTGSQKVQKHRIFEDGTDPTLEPDMIDLRARKRRG